MKPIPLTIGKRLPFSWLKLGDCEVRSSSRPPCARGTFLPVWCWQEEGAGPSDSPPSPPRTWCSAPALKAQGTRTSPSRASRRRGLSREAAEPDTGARVCTAAAGAASARLPGLGCALAARPRRPAMAKVAPALPGQTPREKRAESSSPRRFMGRTRTATFTLVSDMLAAPARPQAAPHAPRRRRHRRAPPERGRRRSAVSSARQRRGARAIPGERDAGHGRGPGRGGRGAGRGARAGRRPRRPRRLSSRAGPAERAAPRPLAAAGGPAAPPSSPPRPPAGPQARGGPTRPRAASSGAGGPGDHGAGAAGIRGGAPGPSLHRRPRGSRGDLSPLLGPLSPQPRSLGVPGGQASPGSPMRLNQTDAARRPLRTPARACSGVLRSLWGTEARDSSVHLPPGGRACVCVRIVPSLPFPSRPLRGGGRHVKWAGRVINSYIRT